MPTILIAAGGTGGHLYPAMAVAEEIRKERPDVKIIFVGTRDRIESREVPKAGYEFYPINIHAPLRSFTSLVSFPLIFGKAIIDCMRLISKEKPSAMLGAGAYLSVPAGIAAWSFHVPIALLEINSVAGAANKWLGRLAQKLFLAYPEAKNEFTKKFAEGATISGTPVRAGLGEITISQEDARASFELDPSQKTILIFGGSLGARAINQAMESAAPALTENGYNILWQTGKSSDAEILREKFSGKTNVRAMDYIYDMERAYRAADIVVCRAGASSLAELARLGKAAILVPWSNATANHQEANARAFERDGAAIVLTDSQVKEQLLETIVGIMSDEKRRGEMSSYMKRRDNPDASAIVAKWLIEKIK